VCFPIRVFPLQVLAVVSYCLCLVETPALANSIFILVLVKSGQIFSIASLLTWQKSSLLFHGWRVGTFSVRRLGWICLLRHMGLLNAREAAGVCCCSQRRQLIFCRCALILPFFISMPFWIHHLCLDSYACSCFLLVCCSGHMAVSLWFPLSSLLFQVHEIQACFCFQCMLFSFVISNNFFYLLITTFTWPRTVALITSSSISSSNMVPPEDDFFYPPAGVKLLPFPLFNAFCIDIFHPSLVLRVSSW